MTAFFLAAVSNEPVGAIPLLQKYLPYQGVGLLVVMFALAILNGLCALVGGWFGAAARRANEAKGVEAAVPQAQPVDATAGATTAEMADKQVVAAIAAAISVALARPYRIIEIQTAETSVRMTSPWAIEGRFQHFSSHKIR